MSVAVGLPSVLAEGAHLGRVLATGNGRVPVEKRLPWQAWGGWV